MGYKLEVEQVMNEFMDNFPREKNRFERDYFKCYPVGVKRYLNELDKICLTPDVCNEIGESAARIVIYDFCDVFAKRDTLKIRKECEEEAKLKCKGSLYDILESVTKDFTCPVIKDDASNYRKYKRKLYKKCNKVVEEYLYVS